jgi:hypothetical protein
MVYLKCGWHFFRERRGCDFACYGDGRAGFSGSGLAQRASEHTRIEIRNQFSRVHETAIQDMIKEKKRKNINLNYFFLGTGFGLSLGFFFSLLDMRLFAS